MRIILLVVGLIIIVLAVAVVVFVPSRAEMPPGFYPIETLLPEYLEDADGEAVARADLAGKTLGIYFSAHWCPPCRAFTPELVSFHQQHREEFAVVFVSMDHGLEEMRTYMNEYDMDFAALPPGHSAGQALASRFKVGGLPTLLVLGPDGQAISAEGRADLVRHGDQALAEWRKQGGY